MRTLVYCTAYAATPHGWQTRNRRWLDALRDSGLKPDQILIVDDGSPVLPGWRDTQIFSGDVAGEAFTTGPRGDCLLFHFRERLGRIDMCNFPGWHRSYVFGALYAEANGFERVIHLESDAFLVTRRAVDFLANYRDGWAALHSPRFAMPELAISVAAGNGLRRLAEFARQPYAHLAGRPHEPLVPFTHVERGLVGDRYGQDAAPVPRNADYAAQIPSQREPGYYWWRTGAPQPGAAPAAATYRFTEGGNGAAVLESGWGDGEIGYRWMLGAESTLRLPPIPGKGPACLRLGVTPHIVPGVLDMQRLVILVNGRRVGEFELWHDTVLGCAVPASVLAEKGTNLVRLLHPDAAVPQLLDPASKDTRRLSVSLEWLTVER